MVTSKLTKLLFNNMLGKGSGHMKKFAQRVLAALKDESGQGATEYILLLVVVVALVFMFKGKISQTLQQKMDDLDNQIQSFTGSN
jgi:Flp pilus assembly pilin Flp